MADIKVRDLTDTSSITLDNQVMVLTNDAQNQVQNITVENFITNVISSDSDNVIEQGTDGKLYVETPENITGELADLDTVNKTSLVNSINEVVGNLSTEATTRQNADNNLQSQIDAITAASDVTDIVGTYAQLQAYDTTGLPNNSIIKVLQDESRQNETTYYRWVITDNVGAWVLIGEEGPYYTISQADSKFATQETVGNLSNLATSDKSSVVNAMNELASVLDPTQTADYIKNSKAIYSGEVSENALILPQIKDMAHSTFDASKFTKNGTPNITSDGVVSGFTNSSYIRVSYTYSDSVINYVERVKFTTDSDVTTRQAIRGIFDNQYKGIGITINNGKMNYRIGNNSSWNQADSTVSISANTTYIVEFEQTSTTSTFKLYSENNTLLDTTSVTYTNLLYSQITLGRNNIWADSNFTGFIDLKGFLITVDGVEVFSGNRTGIDTIKPDNYTVVGTPTISADGIASGFSNSNYLITPNITINKPFEIISPIFNANVPTDGNMHYIIKDSDGDFRFAIASSGQIFYRLTIDGQYQEYYTGKLINNGYCQSKLVFNGTQYLIYCKKINEDWELTNTVNNSNLLTIGNVLYIGYYPSNNYVWQGSIDLNAFKIYVDGNLVYQPCLKIPYTESNTGSKIVQSIYRERVSDMYEQYGYAPYYTLSNTDFTLPQGELYGYIEKRAKDIAHPVGVPFYRFDDTINDDEVRLEGAEVDKGLYLAIEEKLSALCTAGSTPDKICLPDFRNRVIWGAESFGYLEAGLPNITGAAGQGSQSWACGLGGAASGAFEATLDYGNSAEGEWASRVTGFNFDASRSSSVYKNDFNTVQPPAVKVRWLARWK